MVCIGIRFDLSSVRAPITVPVISVSQLNRVASFCLVTPGSALFEGLFNFSTQKRSPLSCTPAEGMFCPF